MNVLFNHRWHYTFTGTRIIRSSQCVVVGNTTVAAVRLFILLYRYIDHCHMCALWFHVFRLMRHIVPVLSLAGTLSFYRQISFLLLGLVLLLLLVLPQLTKVSLITAVGDDHQLRLHYATPCEQLVPHCTISRLNLAFSTISSLYLVLATTVFKTSSFFQATSTE